jgi:dienelactone hydrolase
MSKRILAILVALLLLLSGCDFNYANVSSTQFMKMLVKKYEVFGANSLDLSRGLSNIKYHSPSGNWLTTWEDIATEYEKSGNKLFGNNDIEGAIYNLLKSAVYYRISALPFPLDEKQQLNAQKAVALHRNSVKFLDNPPQIIRIPYETKEIRGYLRLPGKGKKYPLLIILPGITGVKEDFFWIEDRFLSKGFAVFTMDIPGTGESQWTMRIDSERVLNKTMDYIINIPDIMPSRISIMGFNMGAYWAMRLAARQEYLIKNVIAVSPPINKAFSRERLSNLPRFLRDIFMQATGETKFESLIDTMSRFALEDNDILRDINAQIFLVGVKNDFFVPQEDIEFITSKTKKPVYYKLYLDEQFSIIENLSGFFELSSGWLENNID